METKSGFTLIEILIVVTILAILGTLSFSMFANARQRSRNGRRKADLETIRSSLEMYRVDNDEYPLTADFKTKLEDGYIKQLPEDPDSPEINYNYNRASNTSYCLGAYLEGSEGEGSTSCIDCTLSDCVVLPSTPCNYCVENP